jgi:hypothetical protein
LRVWPSTDSRLARLAAYQSRAPNQEGGYSTKELRARWRAGATEIGANPEVWLADVFGRRSASKYAARSVQVGVRQAAEEFVVEVIEALETKYSTWGRAELRSRQQEGSMRKATTR